MPKLPSLPSLRPSDLDRTFFVRLLGQLEDPIFVKDAQHRWIFVNDAFVRLVGVGDLIGRSDRDLFPREQWEQFYAGDRYVLENRRSLTQEESIGPNVWALVKKTPVTLPNGQPGILGIIIDITEYRSIRIEVEALRLARRQALHDPLTDLPNRRHLEEYFDDLRVRRGPRRDVVLMHLDLDGFKAVNDENGHAAGDAVLVHVADTIRALTDRTMFAARIGGDEFVILVAEKSSLDAADAWATRFIEAVRKPVAFNDKTLRVGASVGLASATDVPFVLDALLHAADLALYRAKQNGRNRVERYTKSIGDRERAERAERAYLETGLIEGAFRPFYQPQFDLISGEYLGVEALARWYHPKRGLLAPADFLDLFDGQGKLAELDILMFDAVICDAVTLANRGLDIGRISVNVSSDLLFRADLVEVFAARMPLPFELSLELAESISFERLDQSVRDRIDRLKEWGCKIVIDDFGSSQASILGVINLHPDRLKIDRNLIIPLVHTPRNRFVVDSILQIAAALGIPVIAEGIETAAHVDALLKMGCDVGQGFHLSPPLSLDDLATLLEKRAEAAALIDLEPSRRIAGKTPP